MLLYGIRC